MQMQVESTYRPAAGLGVWAAVATCVLSSTSAMTEAHQFRRSLCEPLRLPTGASASTSARRDRIFYVLPESGIDEAISTAETRETSEQEHTIGLLRSWEKLPENWDGERARAPNSNSLRAASSFVCALDRSAAMPEPMVHPTGRAGLYWKDDSMYADLEFLEDGSIAYYVEREKGRHKGVVQFDKRSVPDVLKPLLQA